MPRLSSIAPHLVLVALLVVCVAPAAAEQAAKAAVSQRPSLAGRWEGTLVLGTSPDRIAVEIEERAPGALGGKLFFLDRTTAEGKAGAGNALEDFALKDGQLSFRLDSKPADMTFQGVVEGDKIAGSAALGSVLTGRPFELARKR